MIEFSVKLALTQLRFFSFFFPIFAGFTLSAAKNPRSAPDLCDKWEGLRRESEVISRRTAGRETDEGNEMITGGRAERRVTQRHVRKNKLHRAGIPSRIMVTIRKTISECVTLLQKKVVESWKSNEAKHSGWCLPQCGGSMIVTGPGEQWQVHTTRPNQALALKWNT